MGKGKISCLSHVVYQKHGEILVAKATEIGRKRPKSAYCYIKTLSMQPTKRQTITPDEFRHLAKDFGVTLPEEFLYEK